MKTIGNILWFITVGWQYSLILILAGVFCYATIIGIPFAVACFRILPFAAAPFGKELVDARDVGEERRAMTGVGNFFWVLLAGFWISIYCIVDGIACCVFIIGIPFGVASFKLAAVAFAPLGKRTVSSEMARIIRDRKAAAELDKRLASSSASRSAGESPSPSVQHLPSGEDSNLLNPPES